MIELLTILVPIALIDSTSMVSLGILPLVNMLASPRPYETAWSFILGLELLLGLVMVVAGGLMVVDAGLYFLRGVPLLPT